MAIHCMLLTKENLRIVQNFLSEFKDKYDCMQTFDMVRSMISAWQSANFKDGEEPTMPTKDEIEQFIQSQLGKDKQSSVAPVRGTYEVSTAGDKRFSALNATFAKVTIIDGVDVSGRTIEDVYQHVIKKSGKGKVPAVNSKLNIPYRVSTEGITKQYGVVIDRNLKRNYSEWQKANPNGIVAYRVNYSKYNTPEEVLAGRIGNPFSEGIGQANKGEDTVQKFFTWLTTGENFGNSKATEEYRQAILHKLISTPKGTNILYYTELNRPSHATVLGYLINHKEFITNYKDSIEDFSYYEGYLPLWQEWAKQNPALISELKAKSAGKTLTDKFARTKVNQARALTDIINNFNESEFTRKIDSIDNQITDDMDESDIVNLLVKNGIIEKGYWGILGREIIMANINGVKIPFYRSSNGTSGKKAGKWYQFFGFGNMDSSSKDNDWFIKGSSKNNNEIENGYGSIDIQRLTALFNKYLNWTGKHDKNNMHSVYDFTEKGTEGGNHDFLGPQRTEDINTILYGTKDKDLTGINARKALEERVNMIKANSKALSPVQDSNNLLKNINNVDKLLVDVEQHDKPWKSDPTKSNKTLRVYLKDHSKGYFELVKDIEDSFYSVHFKTAKEGAKYNAENTTPTTKEERKILFKELVKLIPEGAKVSTWGSISDEGIKALDNIGRNMIKVGERTITKKTDGSKVNIPIYQKQDTTLSPVQENGKITPVITTEATPYTKGLPQKNPNTAYLFTENAQAYVTSLQLDDSWIERGYNKGNSVKTGVSDMRGTNQAGIRASSYNTYGATNISKNAFGIIVKKYQQKLSQSYFLSKEGQFKDTDSDFELFKQLNLHMFNNLNNFNAENIVLPNEIALGKAALPLRFAEWLKEELSKRFNANFIIEKNTRADYDGYGIRVINANIKVKEAPIQEDDKSYAEDLARCARQISPIERKHRVERITRMFSSIVNSKLKDKLTAYNNKIQAETNPKVKNDLLFGRKKITRFSVIKSEGVQSIMMEVRKAFQVYADAPLEAKIAIEKKSIKDALIKLQEKKVQEKKVNSIDEEAIDRKATNIAKTVAERKTKAFQNVLNNFQVLAEEALGNLALTEGISVNLNSNFVLNTQENSDTFNEDGKQTNQGDVFEKEESLKDGWMTDVRQVATFDSLTARVRQAIGNMVRYDSTGNVDRDDLGDNIYLNAGYVHSELIQALRNMISAEDMIPMLEQLSKKKVWVKQIINELNNDNQLFTEFYRAYRKDYVNYFIQKVSTNSDTSTSTKVMSINGAEGTAHYFDEWRDNYEYGNILTTDSIYDKNGDIQLKNAKVGLDLVDSLLDIFEDRETIAENLTDENIARIKKAMNMLGISVDSETLENALKFNLDNKAFKPAVNVLLSNLRTIYYDLNKGNEKIKDGEYVDLLNIHGTAFNNIAEVINKVDEDTIESSVRQGDKTMYAHINPSYVTTLIKKLQREDTYKQVLDDYRVCSWFNKNGKWRNSILEEIENSAEVRSNLKHVVLLQYNRKEYAAWTDLDATLALYNMYITGAADRSGSETYGYYQVPMLSDAQSAEFIKFKRYKKGYEEKLLDKFKDLVYQEIDRINLVKERATTKNHIDPIANFDMDDKKMGGAEFKFFPELNQKDENGKTFLQAVDEAKKVSMDEVDNLIKNTIKSIMDSRFKEAVQHYKDIGLYDRISTEKNARFKYVNVYSEEGMNDRMREWFWNSTYFTSQFIELTTTDLAYYKNLEDFQKRNKQDHAPAERLNTLATWNGKPVLVNNDGSRRTVRRVIYLKDNILPANSIDSINEILEARVKDKNDAFTAYDKAAIMSIFNKVNVADAQAYNTLPSFRSTQIMAGMWSDAEETAYNNIMNNKWTASDFLVLWNTRKPYLYTQKNQPDGMGGIMKVPTQHKNSEFLLLTGAMFGQILHSSKLQALNDFMVKNNIDSAMFESAVKDGLQGTINLNDATNYASTMAVLENATRLNGKENPNVVHEFDYNDYGIQTSTPEHGIDKVQLVGTQIRRLISSDMNPNRDPNFKLKYKDREFTQEEWMNYFNAINTANIQEAFKEVSDKFNDIHEVEKELIREVRSNPRYGTDLIRALTLDENGNFNIPLIDPSQTLRIQALLNSILKNRVTKQKINGGALIQASPFGLDEDKQPQIVYNEDGSIKYFEAYLPCPTEELYNALLDPNTHELDINKKDSKGNYIVPEKYREVIGYRV